MPQRERPAAPQVAGAGRATALSVQSLAQQLVGALTGLAVGVLRPGPSPWLLTGAVLLSGALLWLRRSDAPRIDEGPVRATGV
ncbi:hypothetical protein QNO09_10185 [Streptomyces sp. 378]|uniref:hypothetical protein n=1 Tax=Streptomyces sp. 378 TaxID=3049412 RepID=UPI0024C3FA2B|nr:hypothetical protein [Streptomyces sp. 378]MDK1343671.1 hypothetical protein [Streptomyces sp. 378]